MAVERLVSESLLRRVERLSLRTRSPGPGAATGEHRGGSRTSSLELSDHRAYAAGDDFRRVDWNAFARLDTLNVKVAEPQQNLLLHVLLDRSASMEFGSPTKARLAQQIAACLAYLALTQLDGVRLYGMSGSHLARSPRYWGKGQAADALRHVQAIEPGHGTDLAAALGAFLGSHPERGMVVVLTDLLSPTDYRGRLRQLVSAGFEVTLVQVLSDAETRPVISGNLELVDSETGQRRRIGATPAALAAYQVALERWQTGITDECRAIGVRYVPLGADRPIESAVLSDLRRYGVLE